MQAKVDYHSFTGMQQDVAVSKHPANMLSDARNIRLTKREGSTLLTLTNEKGTQWTQTELSGEYLGHCLLGSSLVLFSKKETKDEESIDYIQVVELDDGEKLTPTQENQIKTLFTGNLNFQLDHPIEAIASYENESVRKVYWTDGINQPRVINIGAKSTDIEEVKHTEFSNWRYIPYTGYDFVRTLQLNEKVTVRKLLGASGMFPAGVLQYAFTYYTKHGQESAIFYTTPLLYTSYRERGGSLEDTVENAFEITVQNVDRNFEFLRIYSIMRTSINGTPLCKRVQDIEITANTLTFTDTGTEGNTVDPTELLYKGGEQIACETIEQKDGTLFLGNLTLKRESLRKWKVGAMEETEEPVSNPSPEPADALDDDDELHGSPSETLISHDWNIKHPIAIEWSKDTNPGTSGGSEGSGGGNSSSGNTEGNTGDNQGDETQEGNIGSDTAQTIFGGRITNNISEGDTFEKMVKKTTEIKNSTRSFFSPRVFKGSYDYSNQLTAYDATAFSTGKYNYVPPAGFKRGETYRCGVQFQHETGVWSDPIWIADVPVTNQPSINNNDQIAVPTITVPTFEAKLKKETAEWLLSAGYRKVRAVVVFPEMQDRHIVCQGVCNPSLLFNSSNTWSYCMSSWFFRFYKTDSYINNGFVTPKCISGPLMYTSDAIDPDVLRRVEIQGRFDTINSDFISVDWTTLTMHSPDVAFEEQYILSDFSNYKVSTVGEAIVQKSFSDIDIQTETPTIKDLGSGFIHKSGVQNGSYGIGAGLFYEDFLVDDIGDDNKPYDAVGMHCPVSYLIYPWQRSGSLNNDVKRPEGKGVTTAKLKQKIISNLRYANTTYTESESSDGPFGFKTQVFNSEQDELLKLGSDLFYKGNLDTMLIPDEREGTYFAFGANGDIDGANFANAENISTPFTSKIAYRTFAGAVSVNEGQNTKNYKAGVYRYMNTATEEAPNWQWVRQNTASFGDYDESIGAQKGSVRIKYKSTPHIVFSNQAKPNYPDIKPVDQTALTTNSLPILEFTQTPINPFGGTSEDALKANIWLPCGEPVRLDYFDNNEYVPFYYSYGDTYYQRWDCLKTYAYAEDDINQIVEIGSFMLETHINIDGRYDRNRGQVNNLYMSPRNFNLLNKVYSQRDNFFSYKILDSSYYVNNAFPNQVTWTKEKKAGADTDLWTNITLASTLDMDGSKGRITSLNSWNNYLFCFQEKGISVINFNARVQIPVSDGVPIEITNGYKVDGYRYLNDSIGCSNKFSIKETSSGVYFIDSIKSDLYTLSEGMTDLSEGLGMRKWFSEGNPTGSSKVLRTLYDNVHNDVYCVTDSESLCFSEAIKNFTSFMDYDDIKLIESCSGEIYTLKGNRIYKMFAGNYNNFFGDYYKPEGLGWIIRDNYKPWWFSFISNGSSDSMMTLDKIFSNLDYRLDFFDEYDNYLPDETFDYFKAWNEYQQTTDKNPEDDEAKNLNGLSGGISLAKPFTQGNPQKKFRMWRLQVPRALKNDKPSLDRIRNPWCQFTLGKLKPLNYKAILQDLSVMYYI
jgi:hypothetical protein